MTETSLKYVILHCLRVDDEGNVIEDYLAPVIFPAEIAGKHGAESCRKQTLLNQHNSASKVSGGFVRLSSGKVVVFGELTEKEDGIALTPGPEDLVTLSKYLEGD